MKKEYMSPEMEIIEFDTNDVISTSGEDALIDINVDNNYLIIKMTGQDFIKF